MHTPEREDDEDDSEGVREDQVDRVDGQRGAALARALAGVTVALLAVGAQVALGGEAACVRVRVGWGGGRLLAAVGTEPPLGDLLVASDLGPASSF